MRTWPKTTAIPNRKGDSYPDFVDIQLRIPTVCACVPTDDVEHENKKRASYCLTPNQNKEKLCGWYCLSPVECKNVNSLRPRQKGHPSAGGILECISFSENCYIFIEIRWNFSQVSL